MSPTWVAIGMRELGVKEIAGDKDNPRIVEYHDATTLSAEDDETPWCSAFMNWVLKRVGLKGTMSALARSWLGWGLTLPSPTYGCIAVLFRGDPHGTTGHVGIVLAWDEEFVWLLGGNQGDAVSIARFPRSRVLGYRFPEGVIV